MLPGCEDRAGGPEGGPGCGHTLCPLSWAPAAQTTPRPMPRSGLPGYLPQGLQSEASQRAAPGGVPPPQPVQPVCPAGWPLPQRPQELPPFREHPTRAGWAASSREPAHHALTSESAGGGFVPRARQEPAPPPKRILGFSQNQVPSTRRCPRLPVPPGQPQPLRPPLSPAPAKPRGPSGGWIPAWGRSPPGLATSPLLPSLLPPNTRPPSSKRAGLSQPSRLNAKPARRA